MNSEFENIISEIRNNNFNKEEFINWLFDDSNENKTLSFNYKLFENYKKIVKANTKTMKCVSLKRSPNNNYGYIYDNFEKSKINFIVDNIDLSYYEINFIQITIILIANNILVVGENKDYHKSIPTQKNEIFLNYYAHFISNRNIKEIQNYLRTDKQNSSGQIETITDRKHVQDLKNGTIDINKVNDCFEVKYVSFDDSINYMIINAF